MAEKLIIVMANTDPRNGEELGAPIFQATVAAAMDYDVDVICTATSGRLMKKGVAEVVIEMLAPIREQYDALMEDPAELDRLMAIGAAQAHAVAQPKVDQMKEIMGLVKR